MINTNASARPYGIASKYTTQEILSDPAKAAAFQEDFVKSEADYFEKAHHPKLGMIYDGFDLDPKTGEVSNTRNLSAASKECLDIGVLIKALEGDKLAVDLVGRGDAGAAKGKAVELLSKKLVAFNEFHKENPGYGGFFPWYNFTPDNKITPTWDWKGQIAGLDSGELMWTMLAAEQVLKEQGYTKVAEGYHQYNQLLQDNVTKVFFDAEAGKCRGDVQISDPKSENPTYATIHSGRMEYLTGEHGVHEGGMLVHYLSLLGKDLPAGAADKMWDGISMKRVEHPAGSTWQGFWGSAHESWAYMFLPFRDNPKYAELFKVREEIRSHNAADRGYPGFATSAHKPHAIGAESGYMGAVGIEGINSQPIPDNSMFAVYGAFPMLLQFAQQAGPGNVALAWLHNMLEAPRMEGPFGVGESCRNDGTGFAPVKTADGTLPTMIAMMGGLEKETAAAMKERGIYEPFMKRIESEYQESFGDAPLKSSDFALPTAQVPKTELGEYEVKH